LFHIVRGVYWAGPAGKQPARAWPALALARARPGPGLAPPQAGPRLGEMSEGDPGLSWAGQARPGPALGPLCPRPSRG